MIHKNIRKLLIISLGSMGNKYLEIVREYWPNIELGVVTSSNPKDRNFNGIKVFNSIEKAIKWGPSAALVASPASEHVLQAIYLSEAGIPKLIEKPLGIGLESKEQLNKLINLAKSNVICLGYVLRQSPCAKFMKKMLDQNKIGKLIEADFYCSSWLPNWRKGRDYRETVSSKKLLGGGVLLEMSHEIDMALWLLDEIKIIGSFINNSNLLEIESDVEDTALLLGENKANVAITIRINFCSKNQQRLVSINGEKGALIWDVLKNKVILRDVKDSELYETKIQIKDLYKVQLEEFFSNIEKNSYDLDNLKKGIKVLELIKKIR